MVIKFISFVLTRFKTIIELSEILLSKGIVSLRLRNSEYFQNLLRRKSKEDYKFYETLFDDRESILTSSFYKLNSALPWSDV